MDFLLTDSSIIQIHTLLTTSSILFWNLFKNFRLAADNLCQTKICLHVFHVMHHSWLHKTSSFQVRVLILLREVGYLFEFE